MSEVFPRNQVITIGIILASESISVTSLFPFVTFMVRSFGVPDEKVGNFVGLIASSFTFSQFLSSFFFGRLADNPNFGRRKVLLWGLLANIFSIVLFGFATNLFWAIAARSINGLLNGNLGVAKTLLSDITTDKSIARAWVYIGVIWGAGASLGPAIGGLLAEPAKHHPGIFSATGLFGRYPYLLPCLANALVAFLAFLGGYLFLFDPKQSRVITLGKKSARKSAKFVRIASEEQDDEESNDLGIELEKIEDRHNRRFTIEDDADDNENNRNGVDNIDEKQQQHYMVRDKSKINDAPASAFVIQVSDSESDIEAHGDMHSRKGYRQSDIEDYFPADIAIPSSKSSTKSISNNDNDGSGTPSKSKKSRRQQQPPQQEESVQNGTNKDKTNDNGESSQNPGANTANAMMMIEGEVGEGSHSGPVTEYRKYSFGFLVRDRRIRITLCCYAIMGLIHVLNDEIFSLFASTSRTHHGLEFTSDTIGTLLMVGGFVQLLCQSLIFTRMVDTFGYVRLLRINLIAMIIVYPLWPTTYYLLDSRALALITVQLFVISRNMIGVLAFNSINILVNNTSPPGGAGSVNGLSQSLVALTRSLAPYAGGTMFAFSISGTHGFPLDVHLVFLIMGSLACIALVLALQMKESHNLRRTKVEDVE